PDCKKSKDCLILPDDGGGHAVFGARPVPFYLQFDPDSNFAINGMYTLWKGGSADCSTPIAAREAADWGVIVPGIASVGYGATIGGLLLSRKGSSADGMTVTEADAVACGGASAAAPDPGYAAMTWGASQELLLEYNATTKIGFKVIASQGYKGMLTGD